MPSLTMERMVTNTDIQPITQSNPKQTMAMRFLGAVMWSWRNLI